MSVINKKPYIEGVLESLTKQNLSTLIGLVNGGEGNVVFKSYINTSYAFSTDDKGIKRIIFEAKDKIFTGYLIYNNSHCVIIAYDNAMVSQKLKIVKVDYEFDRYEIIDEELSIEEFRRLIEGRTTNLVVEANDVSANPELVGTEDELTGIEIDGVKYKNTHSKDVYLHSVNISKSSGDYNVQCNVFTNSATPFTLETFFDYFFDKPEGNYTVVGIYNNYPIISLAVRKNPNKFIFLYFNESIGYGQLEKADFLALFTDIGDTPIKLN